VQTAFLILLLPHDSSLALLFSLPTPLIFLLSLPLSCCISCLLRCLLAALPLFAACAAAVALHLRLLCCLLLSLLPCITRCSHLLLSALPSGYSCSPTTLPLLLISSAPWCHPSCTTDYSILLPPQRCYCCRYTALAILPPTLLQLAAARYCCHMLPPASDQFASADLIPTAAAAASVRYRQPLCPSCFLLTQSLPLCCCYHHQPTAATSYPSCCCDPAASIHQF
jgi:hypothetical protein